MNQSYRRRYDESSIFLPELACAKNLFNFQRSIYRAGPLASFCFAWREIRFFGPQRRGAGNVRRDVQRAQALRGLTMDTPSRPIQLSVGRAHELLACMLGSGV